jgi:hypothetical protein
MSFIVVNLQVHDQRISIGAELRRFRYFADPVVFAAFSHVLLGHSFRSPGR